MARHRSRKAGGLSPLLVRLIKAAEYSKEDAEGGDISGVPDALREFGKLALWALPIHGAFVPNNGEIIKVVNRVARQQFGLDDARQELMAALRVVKEFKDRDPIESGCNQVMTVSDEAYFYAGLAFGVTLADYSN